MHFLKKAALASAGNIICIFLGQTSNVILSRVLGPAGIGKYRLWISAATIVSTIMVMGIGTANIYFLNNLKVPKVRVVNNAFKLLMVLGPLTAAIVGAVITLNPGYFGQASGLVILLFSSGAGFGSG